jgi:methylated-DNA-[protein]-cysteine S-methyltransferase
MWYTKVSDYKSIGKICVKVKSLIREVVSSPIGEVEILSDNKGLVSIVFAWDDKKENSSDYESDYMGIANYSNDNMAHGSLVASQLAEYFKGKRREFSIDISFKKGTEFQRLVWGEMLKIPFGETRTYAEIASKIGRPKAARAVGMACNKNPLCIVVPCHRVVGSSGSLTGYAGGLLKKQWLLTHEERS